MVSNDLFLLERTPRNSRYDLGPEFDVFALGTCSPQAQPTTSSQPGLSGAAVDAATAAVEPKKGPVRRRPKAPGCVFVGEVWLWLGDPGASLFLIPGDETLQTIEPT